jgi:nitrite reductase (NAD(P)H)
MCPHKRAFVLDHGIIGDDKDGNIYVSCKSSLSSSSLSSSLSHHSPTHTGPLHKRNFSLTTGSCLSDPSYSIISFSTSHDPRTNTISLLLPDPEHLDSILATSKWMVRKATAEAFGKNAATQVEIVGPDGRISNGSGSGAVKGHANGYADGGGCNGVDTGGCGNAKLEW